MSISVSGDNPATYGSGQYPQRTGTAIPEIWTGKLIVKFYKSTVFGEITNTDYEGDIKDQGDKIIVHQTPDVTISDYTKGDTITYEDLTSNNVEMTVDYAKLFAFKIDDIDKIQTNRKLMDDWATDAAEQMKITIDSLILSTVYTQVAAANAGNTAGAISGNIDMGSDATPLAVTKANILDIIVDAGLVLDEQNVPEEGRYIVLPAAVCALIKKSDLKDASLTGDGASVLRNGRLGMIDRFTIYSSNNVPAVNGNYRCIFGTNHAISFASQIAKVEFLEKLESTFGSAMRGLNVFGFKVMKPEAIGELVIAK